MDMEKKKRFSTLVAEMEIEPIYIFSLITVLCHSAGTSFASTLSIKKFPSFCLSGNNEVFVVKSILEKPGLSLLK